jgi:hypothetical protein
MEIAFQSWKFKQLLCFWILSIVLFYLKYNISETVFCLRLQVEPTQLGPIDTASPYSQRRRQNPVSETLRVLSKNRMMDNVQEHNSCINMPSSQTLRSYWKFIWSKNSKIIITMFQLLKIISLLNLLFYLVICLEKLYQDLWIPYSSEQDGLKHESPGTAPFRIIWIFARIISWPTYHVNIVLSNNYKWMILLFFSDILHP